MDIQQLKAINYWDGPPQKIGFSRSCYGEAIIQCVNNRLLKVLVGQRRSGKSYILKQLIYRLLQRDVPAHNILYLNFELYELQSVQHADALLSLIQCYWSAYQPKGKTYLFFDEIQEVEGWEKVVNSYLANERYDVEIFITGSNGKLLSAELSTYVTGRYITFTIYPFSFHEYCDYKALKITKPSLVTYLEDSGVPELFHLTSNEAKRSYVMALRDSIVMNDVVKRFNIQNPKLLMLILEFLVDNIGHLFSLNAITKKLKTLGVAVNVVTLGNYIHYLEMTYLIRGISRYDIKGKRILDGGRKYYINDLGFSNYLQSTFDNGINRKLENYVYLVLAQAGCKVYVGNIYKLAIDFVAEKNNRMVYVQVAYLLHSDSVIKREYGNLEKIQDHWPKWVVSLDDVSFPAKNGIQHIPAWELVNAVKTM